MEACDLTAKHCTPCQGGVPPMDAAEAERRMADVPDWTLKDDGRRIERTWRFKDFVQAFELVKTVADLAEAEGHHPDVTFGWGYATVSLYTHKIDGLHENDFILAAKIDAASA